MDAPPPPQAPRTPPSLRWAWLFHLGSAILGVMVLWVFILMILDAGFPRRLTNHAIVAGMGLFQIGLAQFTRFRIHRQVAAKAPGMCPVCEYALEMTRDRGRDAHPLPRVRLPGHRAGRESLLDEASR